ncbi:hypothetical protein ACF0H5_003870 [Mactra antiquata]
MESSTVTNHGMSPNQIYTQLPKSTGTTPLPGNVTYPPITIAPALKPTVQLGLTCTYISLYGILFFMVYIQLWMIWYYRHKRFSYQTVFLFLALIWSGLRVTLFAYYFKDCTCVNLFPPFVYWLMFCLPVCLQFVIVCLLVSFFAQVVFKAKVKYEPNKFKRPIKTFLVIAVVIFFTTNISCAVISKTYQGRALPLYMLYIRVAINDLLFILMGVLLSVFIYKMTKMSAASVVLEAKGTTMCQALVACVLIVFLYLSRAVYNIITVCLVSKHTHTLPSFGYGWINVTDQADFVNLEHGYAYLSFAVVLFVWEILPMFTVIFFFRVRTLGNSKYLQDVPSISQDTKAYFFDNPRRYDSDDEEITTRNENHLSYPGLSPTRYSINDTSNNVDSSSNLLSITPTRTHTLGYGAVMTADRNYGYSVSPITHSPSQT